MAIHQPTKNKIIDLYFKQHLPIREIAKITKKSSRDIILVLRTHEPQEKEEEVRKIENNNTKEPERKEETLDKDDKDLAPYTKAYKLFSEGKRPIQVALILKLPEAEVTKYYIEYLRLTQLPDLPLIFKELGVKDISVFLILTQKALAENLKTDEVLNLLKLGNDKLPKLEDRIEKMQVKYDILKYEVEDHEDLLYRYNEKIASAKLIIQQLKKSSQEIKIEFLNIYNENQRLHKLTYEFKHNDKGYLEVQNIAEDKVKTFLTDNNAMKLLEFALAAVTEGLRQDPQRQLLIEKTPPLQNYDFKIGQSPFQNIYDYPHTAKEKVLEFANKIYNELVEGLTDATIFTAAWDR
jgi:hypothetical protein